ncbi:TlpA disulfide reductase family protein [Sphingomonas kaistensis]|uniref:TlpA disulfide reductase family protein n=1 Tax=Sphingomonas kaistensis TaxID=298708 RepID=A0ABZ2FZY9_9SPHN
MSFPQAVEIGPLLLATDRVLALVLISVFLLIAIMVSKRADESAEGAGWWALVTGLVAARLGYAIINWEAFAVEPASILAFWQGGFSLVAGVAAAVLVTLWKLRLRPSSLLMAGAILMLSGAYIGSSQLLTPAPRPFPAGIAVQKLAGESLDLSKLRGQPMVINLWASWCLPCRREMPMMVDVASTSSVPILLVNSGEERAVAEEFLWVNRLPPSAVYLDTTASLAAAIEAGGYPATVFVNAAGEIKTVHVGELSRAMLTSELRHLEQRDH